MLYLSTESVDAQYYRKHKDTGTCAFQHRPIVSPYFTKL